MVIGHYRFGMVSVRGIIRRLMGPTVRAGTVLQAIRELPVKDLTDLFSERPVLVIAPHPDDETLGCGGLIAEYQARGQPMHVLVLTDGSGSHPRSRAYPGPHLAALREREARAATATLGLPADHIHFLGLPDGRAPLGGPRLRSVAVQVAAHARERLVGTICVTWEHDPHRDHRAAYRIGRLAAREIGARLLCYPVWGWTVPETARLPATQVRGGRIEVSRHLGLKERAIACHESQTTGLISDDPGAFRLSPEFLSIFTSRFEVFIEG
jgi:LmbE family N-acetylglucosaminyl deacetylase